MSKLQSLLTVAIPENIQPLLQGSRYQKVLRRQKLVLAAVIGCIITAIGVNAWWVVTAQTRRMDQLLQTTQTLTTENQYLEALIRLTQVGQMLRGSNTQNSSVLSSASTLFLELVPTKENQVSANSFEFREHNQLNGHSALVWSVAFSPDGQTIASASDDQTVKLWDRQGPLLNTLDGHSDTVWSVAFSPDGQTIASASDDQTVRLQPWSLETFVALSCEWLNDYLRTNPQVTEEDKALYGISNDGSVTPIQTNTSPIANPDKALTSADTAIVLNVLANDRDPDGDTLIIDSIAASSQFGGSLELNPNNTIIYTPAGSFTGTDVFNYTVQDSAGNTAMTTVDVQVNSIIEVPSRTGGSSWWQRLFQRQDSSGSPPNTRGGARR